MRSTFLVGSGVLPVLLALSCGSNAPADTAAARRLDEGVAAQLSLTSDQWAGIANGRLIAVAGRLEDVAQAIARLAPRPPHAFLVDGGARTTLHLRSSAMYGAINVIGNRGMAKLGLAVEVRPTTNEVVLHGHDRTATFALTDLRPVIPVRISSATEDRVQPCEVLLASGCPEEILLVARDAASNLAVAEEPGAAQLEFVDDGSSIPCSRAFVRVSIAQLDVTALLRAAYPSAPSAR